MAWLSAALIEDMGITAWGSLSSLHPFPTYPIPTKETKRGTKYDMITEVTSQEQILITYERVSKPRSGSRRELRRDCVTSWQGKWLGNSWLLFAYLFVLIQFFFCYLVSCHHLLRVGFTGMLYHIYPNGSCWILFQFWDKVLLCSLGWS